MSYGLRRYGLIGWPLEASYSPTIHEAAFRAAGLGAEYRLYPVLPAELGAFVQHCRTSSRLDGFQVTIPHKVAVVALLDAMESGATMAGAVNTVVRAAGPAGQHPTLVGHNTDIGGFRAMLARLSPPSGCAAVVLGAGGAARAVVCVLVAAGHPVSVVARRPDAAQIWLQRLCSGSTTGRCSVVPWTLDGMGAASGQAQLLVNTTPVGTDGVFNPWPASLALPPYVADLIAWPEETPLLRRAKSSGASGLGGQTMLVSQAAEAFTLWTGQPAPLDVMAAALANLAPIRHPAPSVPQEN